MRAARAADAIVLVLATLAVLDVTQLGLEPLPVVVAAQLVMWLLLLLRRARTRALLVVPVVPVVLGVLAPGTNDDTVTQALAVNLAAFWIGKYGGPVTRVVAGALVPASVLAIELQQWPLDRTDLSDLIYLSVPGLLALSVGARFTQRARDKDELLLLRAQLAEELEARSQQLLAEERERISRELHDVVAQGAGAVVAQATAARLLVEQGDGAGAAQALGSVEDTAREALADMRRLLGVLRGVADEAPAGAVR